MTSGRRGWRQIVFSLLLAAATLLLLEGLLQLLAMVSPRVDALLSRRPVGGAERHLPDELLGHRPNPAYPDHDARGFRNPGVRQTSAIVALGDSQTYGMGVESGEAWPRRLEELLGVPVYNMGYGGWGPAHSLLLVDEALGLKPRLVVEAVYAGNDLYDAYSLVWLGGRLGELASDDPEIRASIAAAQEMGSLADGIEEIAPYIDRAPGGSGGSGRGALRELLAERSRLYGVLRAVKSVVLERRRRAGPPPSDDELWQRAVADAEARPYKRLVPFSARSSTVPSKGPLVRTVFTPDYRLHALDLEDPRLAEGLRIALFALEATNDRLRAAGVDFLVALLPTRELAFRPLTVDAHLPPAYERLVAQQERFFAHTRDFLDTHEIPYLDLLPALQAAVAAGETPYPVDWDDHPRPAGHRLIAAEIAAEIVARGLPEPIDG